MKAAIKILSDIAIFRFKRLECANVLAALSLSVALRLPWPEVVLRFVFAGGLNLLAILTNDYFDVDEDLRSPSRDLERTRFLRAHMNVALITQFVLAALLTGLALLVSKGLVLVLIVGAGNCLLYSWKLKRVPYWDVISMIVWGAVMPLAGVPLDSLLGWYLVGQLALYSACFESIQVIRDRRTDMLTGVKTTAVHLGTGKTVLLLKTCMILNAVYGALLLHTWLGVLLALAVFVPIREERAAASWNGVRVVMGIAWLGMLASIYIQGGSRGLIAVASLSQRIAAFGFLV